jgi:hypothetical protein
MAKGSEGARLLSPPCAVTQEGKMSYVLVLIFMFGNSLTAVQLGNKTYGKLEDCLTAAQAASQQEHFSNNYSDIRAIGYCALQ